MKFLHIFLIVASAAVSLSAGAESDNKIIKIANGINQIDFTGDGRPDLIISAHRENGNAHSFEVVSFYVAIENRLNVVPIFEGDKEQFEIGVSGGADCLLHDFRLLKGSVGESTTLVLADRELGASFADPEEVRFTFYTLKYNRHDQDAIGPTVAFVKSKVVSAKKHYCDVGAAFQNELNLGSR